MKIPEPVKTGDMAVKVSHGVCSNMRQWPADLGWGDLGQMLYVERYAKFCNCCVVVAAINGEQWGTCISTLLKISPDADTEDMETESPEKIHA